MKWKVRISGNEDDLNEIILNFNTEELEFIRYDNYTYMQSKHFQDINNPEEVLELGRHYISIIQGSADIFIGHKLDIVADIVINFDDDKIHAYIFNEESVNIRDRVRATLLNGVGEQIITNTLLLDCMKLSLQDERVRRVLKLVDNNGTNNWVNLYRIFEIIESDVNPVKKGWITRKDEKRFTHTANHPNASGESSRHGFSKQQPPESPMQLTDAKEFVLTVLRLWINEKIPQN